MPGIRVVSDQLWWRKFPMSLLNTDAAKITRKTLPDSPQGQESNSQALELSMSPGNSVVEISNAFYHRSNISR